MPHTPELQRARELCVDPKCRYAIYSRYAAKEYSLRRKPWVCGKNIKPHRSERNIAMHFQNHNTVSPNMRKLRLHCGQRNFICNPLAFRYCIDKIRRNVLQIFSVAVRPANIYLIYLL